MQLFCRHRFSSAFDDPVKLKTTAAVRHIDTRVESVGSFASRNLYIVCTSILFVVAYITITVLTYFAFRLKLPQVSNLN